MSFFFFVCLFAEIPITNKHFNRLKSELEADMSEEDKVNCETSLCIPSIDIFDFEDDKDKIDTGNGSELTVDEGSSSSYCSICLLVSIS